MVGADCSYTVFRQYKCSIGLDTHDVELTNGSIMGGVESANVSMIVVPINEGAESKSDKLQM